MSLAIISHASLPLDLWDHVFQSVVFLINRIPPSHSSSSPYTNLFKREPDYLFLRVIGCLCFPLLRPYNAHKLQFRSLPCVFLGYCETTKGYKCLHIPTSKVYVSRNVRFEEAIFPFAHNKPALEQPSALSWSLPSLLVPSTSSLTENPPALTLTEISADQPCSDPVAVTLPSRPPSHLSSPEARPSLLGPHPLAATSPGPLSIQPNS